MRRHVVACGIVALVFSLLAACGLPTDDTPRAIGFQELPNELGPDVRPTPDADDGAEVPVWMIGADKRLFPVVRSVQADPDRATYAENVLRELILGTALDEARNGITSSINSDTEIVGVFLREGDAGEDRVLLVDLEEDSLASSSLEDRRLAYAQMVWTMTELPFVDAVTFLLGDDFALVPVDGALSPPGTAIGRGQYPSLDPRPAIAFPDGDSAPVGPVLPTPIPAIPEELLAGREEAQNEAQVDLVVWMIDGDGLLIRRPRSLDERDPGLLLRALLDGPIAGEAEANVRSSLLPSSVVLNADDLDVDEGAGTAFVDLGSETLPALTGDNERLRALAQIVYTVTELREINQVSITIEGVREPLPTQDGLTEGDVLFTREDFALLVGEQVFGIATPTPTPTPVVAAPVEPAPPDGSDGAEGSAPADAEPTASPTPTSTPTPTTPTATPTATSTPFPLQVAPTATQVP